MVGILMSVVASLIAMLAFGVIMIAYSVGEEAWGFIINLGQSGINTYANFSWKNKRDGFLTRTIRWVKEKMKQISVG
jgi:ABC-type uncharacterized transport system permease subunit